MQILAQVFTSVQTVLRLTTMLLGAWVLLSAYFGQDFLKKTDRNIESGLIKSSEWVTTKAVPWAASRMAAAVVAEAECLKKGKRGPPCPVWKSEMTESLYSGAQQLEQSMWDGVETYCKHVSCEPAGCLGRTKLARYRAGMFWRTIAGMFPGVS